MTEGAPKVRIGKLLAKARSKASLSHEALAAALQGAGLPISASRLAAIENGDRLPDTEVAAALEGILGLDLRGFDLPPPKVRLFVNRNPPHLQEEPHPVSVRPASPKAARPPRDLPPKPEKAKVADFPRLTVYLGPETKALIEGASRVFGVPVYQLLTSAFLEYYRSLPRSDRDLIEKVSERWKGS